MKTVLGCVVLAGMAVGCAAAPARAQVYPERVRESRRHVVADYQHRTRGDENRAQAVDRFQKVLHIGADGVLEVSNIAGDISVTRGSGNDVTVDVVRTARGRDDADAKEQLALVRVDVNEHGNRAEVRERYPERGTTDRHNWSVTTDFTIAAPAGVHIMLKSVSGSLKVTGIQGEVSAETVSGDVQLASIGHLTNAKSVSGNVTVEDTKVDGSLDAGSVSGDVRMVKVTARRLSLGSVSGNVRLEDVQADQINAHTTSGNATFAGTLARNGRYELKSFSGEVRLNLSGDTGFELDASSFSGDVRCDLPLTVRGGDEHRGRRRSLSGTYRDGSAILNVTTFSGSVVIAKR